MSTKFIKFSVLTFCLILCSCDFIYDNYLSNEEEEFHGWVCNQSITIVGYSKSINPCTYTVNYTNDYYEMKGRFQISFKNNKNSYHLYSNEVVISKGQQSIHLLID